MKFWTADDGVKIAYEVFGEAGDPAVILQHGFASHLQGEWKSSGIAKTLAAAGRYVIVMHARADMARRTNPMTALFMARCAWRRMCAVSPMRKA